MSPMGHRNCSVEPKGVHLLRPHQEHQAFRMLGMPVDAAALLDGVQGASAGKVDLQETNTAFTTSLK